jgi:hypothetical protein
MRKTFKIVQKGQPIRGNNGKWRLECKTTRSVCVVFWGTDHIPEIDKHSPPFLVSCDCKVPPQSAKDYFGHNFWVNERYKMTATPIIEN